MRYIAHKLEENKYEVIHINSLESVNGGMIEVVIGKNEIDKNKLEETIKAYKNETKQIIEARKQEVEDMSNILEAIKNSK